MEHEDRPEAADVASARAVEALSEAVGAIASVLSVEDVLQLIVDRVRGLVGARYAALGIVDEFGGIERFITSGVSTEERARIGPPPRGHGLLGLIIREGRTYRIPDISRHPDSSGFPPNHPPMTSFLGVPVAVKGRSIGNFYLTDKEGATEFSAEDERLVELFALHAGIAIDNARLHEQVRRLAVVAERDRIGRDLHDGVIQAIYAVSLSLEDVPELMAEDRAEAVARIDRAIDALHLAIRDIRNFIFGLRPELLEATDLASGLRALVDEMRLSTLLEVDLDVDTVDPGLSTEARTHVLQVAREALSNAARHARATRISVRLVEEDGALRLEVVDDGAGFEPGAGAREGIEGGSGLGNMRSRAEALGGSFDVESQPGSGTRIILRVPTSLDGTP